MSVDAGKILEVARLADEEAFLCDFKGQMAVNLPNIDRVVVLGPVAVAEPAEGLDAAWAEAEAALPEGWRIDLLRRPVGGSGWKVAAEDYPPDYTVPFDLRTATTFAATPAEALRALAVKLRGLKETP